ncbi:MAG: nitrous oxide-stimulated promoter family protein [Candidatus Krumholzibacteriia bacterium]
MNGPLAAARRRRRELVTVQAMIGLYCRAHHGGGAAPCAECRELLQYARQRSDRCPYGAGKPTCVNCPVHCYAPAMRERVRTVMRYAGPRLVWRHPLLALWHLLDGRRPVPTLPRRT